MRMILAVAAVLYSASAFAQTDTPPMVGDKPLVQVKPKGTKAGTKEAAAKPAVAAPKGKPQSIAVRLQACLDTDTPPMVGDKPLVQVKPKGTKAGTKAGTKEAAAKPAVAAPKGKPQSIALRLQACLDTDDGTKDRLNCYDAVLPPTPKPKPPKAKGVSDCRFLKEEDERLACFNGFAESIPKLPKN